MIRTLRQHLTRRGAAEHRPDDAATSPASVDRRGSALMLVLVLTFAMGGLATSAIYLSSNTTILAKLYDRERDYRYAAEWALALGKARITKDTTLVLPDSLSTQLLTGQQVTKAGGGNVPLARVDLYAGLSGAVNGQYGKAISLVAVVRDSSGARHARRLELAAENFARYAVFTDTWSAGLCYATGEIVRGRAHSNGDWGSCGPPGPIYTDTVSAVGSINGTAQYQMGNKPGAARIPYPTVAKLANLPTLATAANLNITPATFANGGTRIEFVAFDRDGNGTIDNTEGFFRVFDGANTGNVTNDTSRTRMGFPGGNTVMPVGNTWVRNQCGVFYNFNGRPGFVPIAAHNTKRAADSTWLRDTLVATGGFTLAQANSRMNAADTTIMKLANSRCYPAGDPHLQLVDRGAPIAVANRRGGEDTTFTANPSTGGAWRSFPGSSVPSSGWAGSGTVGGGYLPQRTYLWPIHRLFNPNSQGVVYVNGDVWLSGTLRGRVTLYASGSVKFIDDLRYTVDPASLPICQNLMGIITGDDAWLSDNAINRPRRITNTTTKFLDDDQDFFLHGVTLSGVSTTDGGFQTENFNVGPDAGRDCDITGAATVNASGGCLNQAGGVIEKKVYATFTGGQASGFGENRVKDACLDIDSPPYFPLTGRYVDNEFYELDPVKMNANQATAVANLFRALQGATP
jgi:hypothetical protein